MKSFDRRPRVSTTRKMGLAGAGAMLATASTAQAGVIVSPTAVVSNSMGEQNSNWVIGNVIDQSGLSNGFVSGITDYNTFISASPTHHVGNNAGQWSSSGGTTVGSIVFDLGNVYSIERLAIWQGGFSTKGQHAGNINGISLETSADPGFTIPTDAGSFNVPSYEGISPYPVNDFDLTDSVGRYVRLTIDSNHGSVSSTKFGEIAFDVSSAAVPEPTSFAFLATAGLAFVVRRLRFKNRKQAPV